MRDQSYFNRVIGLAFALVLVGATVALALPSTGTAATPAAGASLQGPTVYRNLTITYNPVTAEYSYSVAHLQVPLNVRVIFTIHNFDMGLGMVPIARDATVYGTDGGAMQVSSPGGSSTVGMLPASEVSHTFSLSNSHYQLNVPIPRASGSGAPISVTFSKVFTIPGTFSWGCVVLCGPADMNGTANMFGTISIG